MATPETAAPFNSYNLDTGLKLNIDELIYMLSPMDLPMTLGVDADGSMVVRTMPVDQTTFKWQDEEILTPRVAVAALATTAQTTITVTTNEGLRFATGDLIRVIKSTGATESMTVDGVGTSTLTVTRGYASSTATNIGTGDILIGIGTLLAEGSDPENFRARDRDLRTNYTEIFGPYKIQMSRTSQKVTKYGVGDEWSKQVFNRTRELMIRIEQTLLYGVALETSASGKRSTGGLLHFLTTNVNSSSTQLTLANIATLQQTCYNSGDVPLVLIANPASLATLNDIENTATMRVVQTDSRRGRARVTVLDTEFGTTTIIRNRWCHPYNAFLIKPEGVIRRILDPLMYQPLAKTGDADKAQIVCEEGNEIKGYQHMAAFTGLTSYTAA